MARRIGFGLMAVALVACGPELDGKGEDDTIIVVNNAPPNSSNNRTNNGTSAQNNGTTAQNNSATPNNQTTAPLDCAWNEQEVAGECVPAEHYVSASAFLIRNVGSGTDTLQSSVSTCVFSRNAGVDAPTNTNEPDAEEGDCRGWAYDSREEAPPTESMYETRGESAGTITVRVGGTDVPLDSPTTENDCYAMPQETVLNEIRGGDTVTVSISGSDVIPSFEQSTTVPLLPEFTSGEFVAGQPLTMSWGGNESDVSVSLNVQRTFDGYSTGVTITCDATSGSEITIPASVTALGPDVPNYVGITAAAQTFERTWGENVFLNLGAYAFFNRTEFTQ